MKAILYSSEVLFGLGPILVLWLIGVGMGLPFSVAAVYNGEVMGALILGSVLLGSIGMWGLIQLLKKLIWPDINYSIKKYRFHLICGSLAVLLAAISFIGINNFVVIYMVVPILVTGHLYHVCSKHS
ncbi:hypothetical protein QT397_13010 [Microbulbifer sp. MKSA007]|uniref:hypothetical protein n=1 Tax=Microbulbifer sp. SSSA005 TaxID=3243378 RepID=UPI002B2E2514|nr:hypothetical protein QT397_13010 [Microbulbifer sp. MKSA007]